MAKDKILEELETGGTVIDAKIKERKKEKGKEQGIVFDSLEELTCEKHSDAEFRVEREIPDSWLFGSDYSKDPPEKKGLNRYVCEECLEEDSRTLRRLATRAYDCPNCGVVLGQYREEHHRSPEESWRQMAGREGEHYFCGVCGSQLGQLYWGFS